MKTIGLLLFLISLTSCNTVDPPPDNLVLTLKLEDVSCTEAWINLTTSNLQLPTTITLKQNEETIETINLSTADSLLYIDSLLPNFTYNFQAIGQSTIQSFSQTELRSNKLSVTTMDTTSHNFTWQTWTFGEHSSSVLYDVAIIDENNIWAVGEIYMNDSIGKYNTAHWDGNKWELKQILYKGGFWPIRTIYSFNENDIWFSGYVRYFNGNFIELPIPSILIGWSINKIWGSSSSDLYVVGNYGNIAHYNGTSWTKIESGTYLNIGDIWGVADSNGGYNKYLAADDALLVINVGNNVQKINTETDHSISSVWGKYDKLLYTAGGFGLALYKNYEWEKLDRPDVSTIYNVKGQDHNNVFGLSSTLLFLHFNGFSWQFINTEASNIYYRLGVKNDLITAVGWQGDKAAITLLQRNN